LIQFKAFFALIATGAA